MRDDYLLCGGYLMHVSESCFATAAMMTKIEEITWKAETSASLTAVEMLPNQKAIGLQRGLSLQVPVFTSF